LCFTSAPARSAFTSEIDMMKPPTTLTRRSVFRAGAAFAAAATATPVLTPAAAQSQAAAAP